MGGELSWLLDSPAEEAFDRLTRLAAKLIGAPVVLISILDDDRQFFKSQQGLPADWAEKRQTPLSHSFCQHVVASGRPLVVEDSRLNPLVRDNLAIKDLNVIAYLGVPLNLNGSGAFGALCAIDGVPRVWTEDELATLQDIAASVVDAIDLQFALRKEKETSRALREAVEELDMAEELVGVARWRLEVPANKVIWSPYLFRIHGLDPGKGAPRLSELTNLIHPDDRDRLSTLTAVVKSTGAPIDETYRIRRPDGEIRELTIRAHRELSESGSVLALKGVCFDVTESRRADRELKVKAELTARILESMNQGVVMIDGESRVQLYNRPAAEIVGVSMDVLANKPTTLEIFEHKRRNGEFDRLSPAQLQRVRAKFERPARLSSYERVQADGRIIQIQNVPFADGGLVRTYTDVTALKDADRELARSARTDIVTDLPNRRDFQERIVEALARVRSQDERFALHFIDLDRFKAVNDSLGHQVGDRLLRAVGARLREVVDYGAIARIGGDEFAVLQPDVADREGAAALAERIVASLSAPYAIEESVVSIGASVGVAFAPDNGDTEDQLMKCADLALYLVKNQGQGGVRFYDREQDLEIERERRLVEELRLALSRGQFEVYFQPIVETRSGRVAACEALLRWKHPAQGFISPAIFIPLAERAGLIGEIGAWVLRESCREAAAWPRDVVVAVNLSPVQFEGVELGAMVLSALTSSGLAPSRLELEITEGVLITQTPSTRETLKQLRSLGVRIALDDFGTGFSSLSYLNRFNFDKLKIDKSFVESYNEPRTRSIIRAVVALSRELGIEVTAEGVETEDQYDALIHEGCAFAQGYWFARPMPARELRALLNRQDPAARMAIGDHR